MSRLELINYIQQNLKGGFKKTEIRSALRGAGWADTDVKLAFQAVGAKRRRIMTVIFILVITPLIGFGSAWIYSRSGGLKSTTNGPLPESGQVAGTTTESVAEQSSRDEQRISDIAALQTALEQYFTAHQLYPKNLTELQRQGLIRTLPVDPETQEPYLYTPLGEPALYYSLSFILETSTDNLKAGFQSVSSEQRVEN